MQRRKFITLLVPATAVWPVVSQALQPDSIRKIGVLWGEAKDDPELWARFAGTRSDDFTVLGVVCFAASRWQMPKSASQTSWSRHEKRMFVIRLVNLSLQHCPDMPGFGGSGR